MPTINQPPAIVFDIDGVLANNQHRFGPIQEAHAAGTAPDWDAYMATAHLDEPIRAGLTVLQMARWRSDVRIIFLTGRMQTERTVTYLWLVRHGFMTGASDRLLMRKEGDSYHEFKVDKVRELSADYRIQLIIDDDMNICDRLEAAFTIPVLRIFSHWSAIQFKKEHS